MSQDSAIEVRVLAYHNHEKLVSLFACFAKENVHSKIKRETIRERVAANATRGENSIQLLLRLTRMTWTFTNRDVYLFKAAG